MVFNKIILVGCPMNGGDGYFHNEAKENVEGCPRFGAKDNVAFKHKAKLEELNKELIDILKKVNLGKFSMRNKTLVDKGNCFGIVQLADLHLNELIEEKDDVNNSYDFTVASKRLKKFGDDYLKILNPPIDKNLGIQAVGKKYYVKFKRNYKINYFSDNNHGNTWMVFYRTFPFACF